MASRAKPYKWVWLFSLLAALAPVELAAEVVINEIMYNPSGELGLDDDYEFIELTNTGPQAVNMQGWVLRDQNFDNVFPFPAVEVDPGAFVVIGGNPGAMDQHYDLGGTLGPLGFKLSNGGDQVRLYDPEGVLVDDVAYRDEAPWPTQADGDGPSLELIHPALDNGDSTSWRASAPPEGFGTPGRENSQAGAEVPPQIIHPAREPQNPASLSNVTITVQVIDPGGVREVRLHYDAGLGWQSMAMLDDGAHGDGAANDSRHGATLPAFADQTLVRYYVSADDGQFTSQLPAGAPTETFVYRVDNAPSAPGEIAINEIMYHNAMSQPADVEWIELLNNSHRRLDLSFWSLTDENGDAVFQFPPGYLDAGRFLVVTNNRAAFEQLHGPGVGPVVGDLPFRLGNGGDRVNLYSVNGLPIDDVEYDDRLPWPEAADGRGPSLELIDPGFNRRVYQNWGASLAAGGSPGEPNSCLGQVAPAERDIIINEIMYHPVEKQNIHPTAREYVEVVNRGVEPVNLNGWRFIEGIDFTFPEIILNPAQHLAVCRNNGAFEALYGGDILRVGPYVGSLENSGEDLALANAHGVTIDYVDYDDLDPWPTAPDGEGNSLERVDPWVDGNLARNWRASREEHPDLLVGEPQDPLRDVDERYMNPDVPLGSPGRENTRFNVSQRPFVTKVRHRPEAPGSSDFVRITARVEDPDSTVGTVFLNYKEVAPGQYVPKDEMDFDTWTVAVMEDNGIGPDEAAGDGIYSVLLPPVPHRTLMRYRVCATDETGDCVAVPYKEDAVPNHAYFVHDGVPNYAADNGQGSNAGVARTHADLAGPGKPPVYMLIADYEDTIQAQYLDMDIDLFFLERKIERALGTFVYEYFDQEGQRRREVYDHVMFRARGGVNRYRRPKRSWHIRLRKGHDFRGVDDHGRPYPARRGRIDLNSSIHSEASQRGEGGVVEALSYLFHARAGVISSKTTFAHLRIVHGPSEHGLVYPDGSGESPSIADQQYYGDLFGLYLDVMNPNDDYLRFNGRDPEGGFYDFANLAEYSFLDPLSALTYFIERRSLDWSADFSVFENFVAGYTDPDIARRVQFIRTHLNMDLYNRWRAVSLFTRHYDQGLHNYMYYQDPRTGLWEVAPWDLDSTFSVLADALKGMNKRNHWENEHLFIYFREDFGLRQEFKNELRSLSQLLLTVENTSPFILSIQPYLKKLADADEDRWDYLTFPRGVPSGVKNIGGKDFTWWQDIGQPGREFQIGTYEPFDYRMHHLRVWIDDRVVDPEVVGSSYGYLKNDIPSTPTAVSPVGGELIQPAPPVLMSGPFENPSGATHTASQWIIANRNYDDLWLPAFDWMDPVWMSAADEGVNLTSIQTPPGTLRPNTEYQWRVRFFDSAGFWSLWSEPASFRTGDPPGATLIIEARPLATGVELVFLAVPGATHYRVRYGDESGDYEMEIDGITSTSVQVPNLLYGFDYFFVVEAANDLGFGPPSNEVKVRLNAPGGAGLLEWEAYAP